MKIGIKNVNNDTLDERDIDDIEGIADLIHWFNAITAFDDSAYFEIIE